MILPGWTCTCGVFSGEAKEVIKTCRACGAPRPDLLTRDRARELAVSILKMQPHTSYVDAARKLAAYIENGTRVLKTFDEPKAPPGGPFKTKRTESSTTLRAVPAPGQKGAKS